jgi:hypothetical protein
MIRVFIYWLLSEGISFGLKRIQLQLPYNLAWVVLHNIFMSLIKATITSDSQSPERLLVLPSISWADSLDLLLTFIFTFGAMELHIGNMKRGYERLRKPNNGPKFSQKIRSTWLLKLQGFPMFERRRFVLLKI